MPYASLQRSGGGGGGEGFCPKEGTGGRGIGSLRIDI